MSSPIFDATFGTGRFKREEPMTTTDQSQSDTKPKRDVRVTVTDAMVEAAGEAWLRARLNIGLDEITKECWSEILSAMRVVLAAAIAQSNAGQVLDDELEALRAEAIAAEIRGKPEFKEMIARAEEKPDAPGLIGALAGDLGLILRGLIAKYHGPLRSRASDCPTEGVAARQGNGG